MTARHTEVRHEETMLTHCQATLELMHARIKPSSQRQCKWLASKWLASTTPEFLSTSPGQRRPGNRTLDRCHWCRPSAGSLLHHHPLPHSLPVQAPLHRRLAPSGQQDKQSAGIPRGCEGALHSGPHKARQLSGAWCNTPHKIAKAACAIPNLFPADPKAKQPGNLERKASQQVPVASQSAATECILPRDTGT